MGNRTRRSGQSQDNRPAGNDPYAAGPVVQPLGENAWQAQQLAESQVDHVATAPILTDWDLPMGGTPEIPQYHVIMEQLAHRFAYTDDELHGAEMTALVSGLAGIGYRRVRVVESAETGFQAVLFEPILESAPVETGYQAELGFEGASEPAIEALHTVVAFRGTDNLEGLRDDADPTGIGTYQFAMHEADIRGLLAEANSLGHGPPDVTGHSLGGALAQLAAVSYGDMVRDIITFQSPGLNADEASSVDPEEHASTHYRMAGDLVSTAGDNVTTGEIVRFSQQGVDNPFAHMACPLAMLNARRHDHGENFVPGVYDVAEKENYLNQVELESGDHVDHQVVTPLSETVRSAVGTASSIDMWMASALWRELRPQLDAWAAEGVPVEEAVERARVQLMGMNTSVETQAFIQVRLTEQAERLYKQLVGETDWNTQVDGDSELSDWVSLLDSMMTDKESPRDLLEAVYKIGAFGKLELVFSESKYTPMQVVKRLAANSAQQPREFVQLMAGTSYQDELGAWWSQVEAALDKQETARGPESLQNSIAPKRDPTSGLSTDLEERVALQIEQREQRANQERLLAETREIFADGPQVPMAPSQSAAYTGELQQGLDHRDVPGVARTLEQIRAQFGNAGLDQLLRDHFTYRSFDDVAAGGMNVVAAALLNTSFQR